MRAHAWIVTAEHGAHPGVPGRIVLADAFLRVLEDRRPLAPEESGGPAAMERLELQIRIRDLPAKRDQLLGPVAQNFELAAGNGVEPESPCRLEQSNVVARFLSRSMRAPVGLLHLGALGTLDDRQRGSQFEQESELAPDALLIVRSLARLRVTGSKVGDSLGEGEAGRGAIARALVIGACEIMDAGIGEVMRDHFGLGLGHRGETLDKRAADAFVNLAAAAAQQVLVRN